MSRPKVICHMTMSIDGKVTADADDKPLLMDAAAETYELADVKKCDSGVVWMNYRMKR